MGSDWNKMAIPIQRVISMVRTEQIIKKEDSNFKMPITTSGKRKYTREELDEMVIKLAEAHGIRV